jgi:hypothetical protein
VSEKAEDAPEQLVRHQQLADGSSLGSLENVPFSVPRSKGVVLEHLEEPAEGGQLSQHGARGAIGRSFKATAGRERG